MRKNIPAESSRAKKLHFKFSVVYNFRVITAARLPESVEFKEFGYFCLLFGRNTNYTASSEYPVPRARQRRL